jgi:hypothetical protein
MSQSVINRIVWPVKSPGRSQADYDRDVEVVKLLCTIATPKWWLDSDRLTYKMPYVYELDGVEIEFLTSWAQIVIGGINLAVPTSKEEILRAVEAIKLLMDLGYRPKPAATMY